MTEKEIRDSIGHISVYEKFYEEDIDYRLCDNLRYNEKKCRHYCRLGSNANCCFECCYYQSLVYQNTCNLYNQDEIDAYYGEEE